jgi:3-hydroxybutyryl-CoA dehydratase
MEVSQQFLIDEKLVEGFAQLIGDNNPIHLDKEFAKNTIFGRPIAHGMLISSFFSRIIAQTYPGPGSIYLSQNIKFLKPCFVGDEIIVKVVLENKVESEKKIMYKLLTSILKGDELLVEGNAEVMIRK